MLIFRFILTSLFLLISASSTLKAEENSPTPDSIAIKDFKDINMTEIVLKNGMKVILKPTDDDADITVSFSAIGGLNSIDENDKASADLSGAVMLESGLGDLSADQLSAFLYDYSIELSINIEPFTREIYAEVPDHSLEAFMALIKPLFTKPKLSRTAFSSILTHKKSGFSNRHNVTPTIPQVTLLEQSDKKRLEPLTLNDLEKANIKNCRSIFREAFSNPADFVCIIAGDFEKQKVQEMVIKHFNAIEGTVSSNKFVMPRFDKSPRTIFMRTQVLPFSRDVLVKLDVPLELKLDHATLDEIEVFCLVEETRLRSLSKHLAYNLFSLDVNHELPFFPSLENPWITIQFYVGENNVSQAAKFVVEELKLAQSKGILQTEVDAALKEKAKSLKLWQHDNVFWVSQIANYYMWNWDPTLISQKFKEHSVKSEKINKTLQNALKINQYSLKKLD